MCSLLCTELSLSIGYVDDTTSAATRFACFCFASVAAAVASAECAATTLVTLQLIVVSEPVNVQADACVCGICD